MNYDSLVSDAKRAVTVSLIECQRTNGGGDFSNLASAIDELNRRWDRLTGALVRQCEERDELIGKLLNELAEAKT